MPTVTSEITIAAPVERVYEIARDIERFPEFMADVAEVEILEQTEGRQVSRWAAVVREFNRNIRWTEEDFWNAEERTCDFALLEGDFSEYSGTWRFESDGEGTCATLVVNYGYNVPLIGALIQGVLQKKTQANCDSMLAGIKAEAENGGEQGTGNGNGDDDAVSSLGAQASCLHAVAVVVRRAGLQTRCRCRSWMRSIHYETSTTRPFGPVGCEGTQPLRTARPFGAAQGLCSKRPYGGAA